MAKRPLKGTKTIENLMKAFAGESQARNRYTMYAGVASHEGHTVIENIFLTTAENERLHAKEFYKFILSGADVSEAQTVHVDADYPVSLGTTEQNLLWAASGEHEEANDLYVKFADEAEKEGFTDIAFKFRTIAKIEAHHESRYLAYAKMLKDGTLYKKTGDVEWICRKCGHIHTGSSAPEVCPVCAHPHGYFELLVKNY
jgi:rubrerythrin